MYPRNQTEAVSWRSHLVLGLGALWASSYSLAHLYHTPESVSHLLRVQVIPLALLVPAWLLFVLGRIGYRFRQWQSLLFVIPIATILITWHPASQPWMWSIEGINQISGITSVQYGTGQWYQTVFVPYNYIFTFVGLIWLISTAVNAPATQRWEFYLLIWTRLFLEGIIYFTLSPLWQDFRSFDITPIGFTLCCIIYTFQISRRRLSPTSPLAYRKIFESLELSMIVVNHRHQLLEYNSLAATSLGLSGNHLMTDIDSILPFITKTDWTTLRQNGVTECQNLDTHWHITQTTISKGRAFSKSRPLGYVLCLNDVSQQRKLQAQLLEGALLYDPLTELPNRTLFMKRLEEALTHKAPLTVLFLDLDRFKSINDSLGHRAGDHLLKRVAQQMHTCLQAQDMLARFGGDEFAILREGTEDAEDLVICDRIQAAIQVPIPFENYQLRTSASIGVAFANPPETTSETFNLPQDSIAMADQLIRNADLAMYQAKASGKACHRVYNEGLHQRAMATIEMEADLRQALTHNQFELYYQPIVDIDSETIVGVEALLRWHHPAKGLLNPPAFIPIAEDLTLMPQIDAWVIKTACHQYFQWRNQYPDRALMMGVNVSAQNWGTPKLLSAIKQGLAGQDGHWFKLEISEDTLLNNTLDNDTPIQYLKKLGVSIQLDDFGTGYSSLSYLCQICCDGLKIDKSFVRDMQQTPQHYTLVKTIIDLAHALNLTIVAEGIETVEQREILKALGCAWGQGYLWAKPIPAKELEHRFMA
ncbi:EAL domain-containing protein [Leptothoe kymatousa TAU-MAC 1615]|uniref:EAL domain-containing protein n=1 Tax=Leptothoe kymatousa TAU-MAC 1615 TaxID=2364775 RepID=A0ABS5Y335_9CYAN|nr:EAL domain-containing protein [Leptothoe kymatousa TAU-MAC 1615]